MRERNLHRVFDRVQQLDDHVGHVAERQFPPLVAAAGGRLSDGAPHLQRVEQQGLLVGWLSLFGVVNGVNGVKGSQAVDRLTGKRWKRWKRLICR